MPLSTHEPSPGDRQVRDAGATLFTASGIAAAFGVASCCGLPFLLATLGLSSAWLGGLALLAAPHRTLLLSAAAICLAAGAVLLWRRRSAAACATGSPFSTPVVRSLTAVGLVIGLVLLTIGYLYA
jgi:mercuric ion transport protein